MQNVIDHHVVFLLETGVRNTRHHIELFVGVGQQFVEVDEVIKPGDAVVLATQNNGGDCDFERVDHWQFGTHVDISACGHGVIQGQNGIGKSTDGGFVSRAWMIAIKNTVHKSAVDGAAIFGQKLW